MAVKMMRFAAIFVAVTSITTSSVSAGKVNTFSAFSDLKNLNASHTPVAKQPIITLPILKNATGHPKLSLIETRFKDEPSLIDESDAGGDIPTESVPAAPSNTESSKFLSSSRSSAPTDSSSADASKSVQAFSTAMSAQAPPAANTAQSRAMTNAAMEAAIMSLMRGDTAFAGTPMGGSVQKILDILNVTMMPKVKDAHKADQDELNRLMKHLKKCFTTKDKGLKTAAPLKILYKENSAFHQTCRQAEAVKFGSKTSCLKQQGSLYQVKQLKCQYYAQISRNFGSTVNNVAIVTKAGSESVQSYIGRLSGTICGHHVHGEKGGKAKKGGWGGGLEHGMLDQYLKAKDACKVATTEYEDKVKECNRKIHEYNVEKGKCNQFQTLMDSRSCKNAVLIKDACEQYASCYTNRLAAFKLVQGQVKFEERDRKAEWRGLKRMLCLISAFADGDVKDAEIAACKAQTVTTKHLIVKYPKIPKMDKCVQTKLYPSTGAYKRAEFAPLPVLAKGMMSVPCSGVEEIPTKPRMGSPKGCKCSRVTLEGHYHAGPLVQCLNCKDVRRSKDRNSCPRGTKIFSPSTRGDWQTFLNSAKPLSAPHFIIDVTRPQNSCGGCTSNAMNSKNKKQKSWRTTDGSPWWLRSTKYSKPAGDYAANCYMDLGKTKPLDEDQITFNDAKCNFHSKSYYCQRSTVVLEPKVGSPASCRCTQVTLASKYAPGNLIKCEQCINVFKSTEKNSCPKGTKIFSPWSRNDWKTFIVSAQPLRAPHWIVDITRPTNGCGGCGKYPMNSREPNQATWKTSDSSPWWLRSTKYNQPSGDYVANCFMDLGVPTSENTVQFDDSRKGRECRFHSRSYYCQPKMKQPKKAKKPVSHVPSSRIVPFDRLREGVKEEIFYFKQGKKLPDFEKHSPNLFRSVSKIQYPKTMGKWRGFTSQNNFAVRWSGFLLVRVIGEYRFGIKSDDGCKLLINDKVLINNDKGLKPMWTWKLAKHKLTARGQHSFLLEYFQSTGPSGMLIKYLGPDTGKKWEVLSSRTLRYFQEEGFKEEIYYIANKGNVPSLNQRSSVQRIRPQVDFKNTVKGMWPGFTKADKFAVRWSGELQLHQSGMYRFMLTSDDGSKLYIKDALKPDKVFLEINNDGLHALRDAEATGIFKTKSWKVLVEYFQDKDDKMCELKYMGAQTDHFMLLVPSYYMDASFADPVKSPLNEAEKKKLAEEKKKAAEKAAKNS